MICTTIHDRDLEHIYEALEKCEMAEIRLDSCDLTMNEIQECFTSDVPLVATCRLSGPDADFKEVQTAERRLVKAIEAGARYVDVELGAPKQMSKRVRTAAHDNGTVFIRSYHDFEGTDSFEALKALVEKCRYHGADIVKLVTTAHSEEDVRRVMALYEWNDRTAGPGRLIAFCMGEAGRLSRVQCLAAGSPFTYAALSEQDAVAAGQWALQDMTEAVYGGFKMRECTEPLHMPCSKSFAQRAVIAAALAEGTSHLKGYTMCGDNESALQVARALGAAIMHEGDVLTITGVGASARCLPEDFRTIHVGESGLLARMMIPLMAQLCPSEVEITGERTLLERPLTGAEEIMDAFGAAVRSSDSSQCGCIRVPLKVNGSLSAGRAEISGRHGSQLISGLLMALPLSERNSSMIVHQPKSIPYMFITLEVLKKFGIKIGNDMLGGRDFLESDGDWNLCTEMVFKIRGGQKFKAADIDLEKDWSAAAAFLAAGAVFGKVQLEGLDTTSLQADLSFMDILMDAGASLSQMDGEKGDVTVQRAPLCAFDVDASNCPDLFPVTAVLAAFCQGTSRIAGVGRLSNKESDRAGAITGMLQQLGVKVEIDGDVMVIEGHTLAQRILNQSDATASGPGLLKGGAYSSYHDHRMVMALKVASLGADGPVCIDDEQCVAKSFPDFNAVFSEISSK